MSETVKYTTMTIEPYGEWNGKPSFQVTKNQDRGGLGVIRYSSGAREYIFDPATRYITGSELRDIANYMETWAKD